MKKMFLLFFSFATFSCYAYSVPENVKAAFKKQFPNATVKKWEKENNNYEANFILNGKVMSATFDSSGKWKETETEIEINTLPAKVVNYIQVNYKGATIKAAAIIQTPETKMFEAEIKGKDLLF